MVTLTVRRRYVKARVANNGLNITTINTNIRQRATGRYSDARELRLVVA